MKYFVKTSSQNYALNIIVSLAFAGFFGIWMPFLYLGKFEWFFVVRAILIFHHFFRAGEYVLTGKAVSISYGLIAGQEEKGNKAKWCFIYYITTASLISFAIVYWTLIRHWL